MEIVESIAQALGISPNTLILYTVVGVILVIGWNVLKFVVKMAWKTFITGCLLIVLLLGGLFVGSILIGAAR